MAFANVALYSHIADEKRHTMENIEKAYEEFASMMMEEGFCEGRDFPSAAAALGVRPEDLDALLEERIGMGGEDLMAAYRSLEKASKDKK